jgi:transposase InsO family protein
MPGSPSQWDHAATPTTTPSRKASLRPSRTSSCTDNPRPTRRELGSALFEYIEAFYNRTRRHPTLDYLAPEEYEKANITTINKD